MIKFIPRAADGFTLVELLISSLAAGLVTVAASSAVNYHMRASASMEAVERTKQDWGASRISSNRRLHSASA